MSEAAMKAVLDDRGNLVLQAPPDLGNLPPGTVVNVMVSPPRHEPRSARGPLVYVGVGAIVVVVLAVAVLAACGQTWSWTGFEDNVTLWDWMTMLVQPVAIAALTFRLAVGTERGTKAWRLFGLAAAAALGLVAIGGYVFGWTWTGFPKQELWDWLHLLLFPIVLILLPEWLNSGRKLDPIQLAAAAVGVVAFTVLVWGGYRWSWTWTGFTGNTFRDWLELLIAPFLIPAACSAIRARRTTVVPAGVVRSALSQPGGDAFGDHDRGEVGV